MVSCNVCNDLSYEAFANQNEGSEIDNTAFRWIHAIKLYETASRGCGGCALLLNGIKTLDERYGLISIEKPGKERTGSQSLQVLLNCCLDGIVMEDFNLEFSCFLRSCGSTTSQKQVLPKRILDLAEDKISLVETRGKTGHYIALSYCWGKEQFLKTNRGTLADRLRGIEWKILPKTLQDAIRVTRELGMRYLWIDSLCIIQDDVEDWQQQSALMGDIYARSCLNISAVRASSMQEGFLGCRWTSQKSINWLGRRDSGGTGPPIIRKREVRSFQILTDSKQRICVRLSIHAREAHRLSLWIRDHKDVSPLLQREWAYQERILSPRTIYFRASEMVWACKESLRCECTVLDGTPPDNDALRASKQKIESLKTLDVEREKHGMWRLIVEDYTRLNLTYESDRLPALSGLARVFGAQLNNRCKYLAGFWEGDLARDLLWSSKPGRRLPKPCAPSWSWASLCWGSEGPGKFEYEYETKLENASYRQDPGLSIIDASYSIDGENEYGIVSSGTISLEGTVFAIIITSSLSQEPRQYQESLLGMTFSNATEHLSMSNLSLNYDTDEDCTAGEQSKVSPHNILYCLFIGTFIIESNNHIIDDHRGLMLKPVTESPGNFERIGWFSYCCDSGINKEADFLKYSKRVRVRLT